LSHISENTVKRVALSFLKGYYKYRPRGEGDTIARLDMQAPGGIIADGHLTFNKEDGSPFLATFEATSWDTREEVRFHRQPVLRNMDAMAAALVLTALVLVYGYAEEWEGFARMGKYSTIVLYLFSVSFLFLFIRLLLGPLPRYRYMYAIEQFRQYYADQQWIALAEDVFPDPTDRNLRELKDQCVREGFGLLIVDPNEKAYLVVTPARQQALRRRRLVRFEDAQVWAQRATEKVKDSWRSYLPPWLSWIDRFGLPDFSLFRYKRSYRNHLVIQVAALVVAITLLYDLFRIPPVRYAEEEAYVRRLEELTQTGKPETGEFLVDTAFLNQYEKQVRPPNPLEDRHVTEEGPLRDTVAQAPRELIPGLDGAPLPPEKPKPERAKPSAIDAYDCDRFYGIRGSRYLLLYDLVGEEAAARRKLDTIYDAGIEAGLVWMGCFEAGSGEFAVYLGTIFETPEEAYSQKEKLEIVLQEHGVRAPSLRIRPLVFK
jgi:hypothetical protein